MTAVSGSIPNLIGGVSQQPTEIRALNCSTALTNTWCDVATGLSTRPYSRFIGRVGPAPSGTSTVATHTIRKEGGRYQVTVYEGTIKVVDLDTGELQPVDVVNGLGYITEDDSAKHIGFVTVGDTTFIYNRNKTITVQTDTEGTLTGRTEDGVVRRNPHRYGTVWVKQAAGYRAQYSVYVNGVIKANLQTADASPTQIATTGHPDYAWDPLATSLRNSGFTVTEPSRTVLSVELGSSDKLLTRDDFADQALFGYNDKVTEFTDLPNFDREGRLVRVAHAMEEDADDYWVWYKDSAWEETYGWRDWETPHNSTMPVLLVDNRDGTWTLSRGSWPGRTVGDANSNPSPTFVGRKINHMFIHKNRMCILTDENFVASRVGEFENFYRSTCTQLLDDDPIDIAAPEGGGGALYHAKEFDGGLVLFSEMDQFKVTGDSEGLLSPNTVSIRHANSYNCSSLVTPAFVGPNIIFVDDLGRDSFAQLREYQVERVFGREVALPITDQVPEYIPSGVYKMSASSTNDVVALVTAGDRRFLWVYNYYFNSEGKVQSAWQKWDTPGSLYSVEFNGDRLTLTVAYGGSLYVVDSHFDAGADTIIDDGSVNLDFRLTSDEVTTTVSGNDTLVTLPYTVQPEDLDKFLLAISPENTGNAIKGHVYAPSSIEGNDIRFTDVDLTNEDFLVGFRYKFHWKLSPIFMRDRNLVAIQDGRLQLRKVSLLYNNSGPFTTTFTPTGRGPYTSVFSGWIVGSSDSQLNQMRLHRGEYRISVNGAAEVLDLVVEAWTPWRVRFSSIEWDGRWRPKKKRTT